MIKHPEEDNEAFLSRWSRRKRTGEGDAQGDTNLETQGMPEAEPELPLNTVIPAPAPGKMSTRVEADRILEKSRKESQPDEALTDEDMPDVETLNENSDYTGFMSPGVSEGLRKLALRRLFSGAGFNITDGLDDYDDDFTKFEPLGDLITSDMKHRQEVEEQKRLAKLEQEEAERLAAEEERSQEGVDDKSIEEVEDEPKEELTSDEVGGELPSDGPEQSLMDQNNSVSQIDEGTETEDHSLDPSTTTKAPQTKQS